jgi:tetratricopeptide (TPR) repeat protein
MEQQDWKAAEEALNQALATDQNSAQVWELAAQTQRQLHQFRNAFLNLERAFRLSQDPRLLAEMGHCKVALRDYDEAEGWYRSAAEKGFASSDLYLEYGYCLFRKGDFERACSCFDKALKLAPNSLRAKVGRMEAAINWHVKDRHPIEPEVVAHSHAVGAQSNEIDHLITAAVLLTFLPPDEKTEVSIQGILTRALALGATEGHLRNGRFNRYRTKPWFQQISQR